MKDIKNVFISHYGKDDEQIGKLKSLMGDRGYQLRNSSIDSTKPNQASNEHYIKSLLRDRIRWAGTTIVLSSSLDSAFSPHKLKLSKPNMPR